MLPDPSYFEQPFFHGTARTNDAFDPTRVAYLTPDRSEAEGHASCDAGVDSGIGRVIEVRLKARRPVLLGMIEMQDLHLNPHQVEALRKAGYDCAVGSHGLLEVAVFDAADIEIVEVVRLEPEALPVPA